MITLLIPQPHKDSVLPVPIQSHATTLDFKDTVVATMKLSPETIDIGYKISTWPKSTKSIGIDNKDPYQFKKILKSYWEESDKRDKQILKIKQKKSKGQIAATAPKEVQVLITDLRSAADIKVSLSISLLGLITWTCRVLIGSAEGTEGRNWDCFRRSKQ